MSPGARNVAAILRRRAQALALRDDEEQNLATTALVTFSLRGYHIGVPVGDVKRAAPLRHLSEIPGGPRHLIGVTAVDGHLVSLVDLTLFYDLPRHGVGDITGVVAVGTGAREIGLCAEQLTGIEDVPARALQPLPGAVGALVRLARVPSRELWVLDVKLLFDDARLGKSRG